MPNRHPPHVLSAARALRSDGESIKRIAARLGVSVAWVSVAVRDIELTEAQRDELYAYRRGARAAGAAKRSATFRASRVAAQERGRDLARDADGDFMAGCMLHWAEGAKARNVLSLVNSDVELLRYWVDWMTRWLGVTREDLVLRVNCFLGNGLLLEEIEAFWLDSLGLPDTCLRRSIVNRPSRASKGVRRPLVHGTACVTLHSTAAVQLVYGALQEFVGFERSEWLDMGTVSRPG